MTDQHPELDNTNADYQQGRCDQLVDMMNFLIKRVEKYKRDKQEPEYNSMMFTMMELHAEFGPKQQPAPPPKVKPWV